MAELIELTPSVRDEISKEKWDVLLESSLGATVFHSAEWALALKASFRDLDIRYIVIEDQYGRYIAGMPFAHNRSLFVSRYVSMPFGTYGGPLVVQNYEEEALDFVVASIQGVTRSLVPLSFCCVLFNTPPVVERVLNSAFPGGRRARCSTHLIDLTEGFRQLWDSSFDKETRTCARKAARNGVKVERDTSEETARILHALYRKQAASWGLKRIYPERLIQEIVDIMKEKARIWVARLRGVPVCAVLVFCFRDSVMAWLSGQNADGRRVCASHLVYSQILKDACENGYNSFNFGASGDLHGVRQFKESFGAREYHYSIFSSESTLFRLARKLKGITVTPPQGT